MQSKKIYIAGPMTGLPEFNYPAFNAAAAALRKQGYTVFNPAENPVPPCGTWQGYMRMALAQLVQCDAIVLLPGWTDSRGALIERKLAQDLGMQIDRYMGGNQTQWEDGTPRSKGGAFDVLYAPRAVPDSATAPKKTGPKPTVAVAPTCKPRLTAPVNTAPAFNTPIPTREACARTSRIRGRGDK